MKNKKLQMLLPPLVSLIVAIACGFGMMYLYKITKYLPLYLLGLTILLPSAINLSLFVLKIPAKKKERKEKIEISEEIIVEKKFKRFLRSALKATKKLFFKALDNIYCKKSEGVL